MVDWIESEKSYPGRPRFKDIHTILHVLNRTEYTDRCTFDTRIYISSAPLDIEFKDDLSRYRAGHGAKNMAVVRRFALGLLRANKSKGSIKTRRKSASWNTQFLLEILQMK